MPRTLKALLPAFLAAWLAIGVSPATVKRDLNVAKAWLHREIRNARP